MLFNVKDKLKALVKDDASKIQVDDIITQLESAKSVEHEHVKLIVDALQVTLTVHHPFGAIELVGTGRLQIEAIQNQ